MVSFDLPLQMRPMRQHVGWDDSGNIIPTSASPAVCSADMTFWSSNSGERRLHGPKRFGKPRQILPSVVAYFNSAPGWYQLSWAHGLGGRSGIISEAD